MNIYIHVCVDGSRAGCRIDCPCLSRIVSRELGVGIEFIARVSGILIERAMLELPIQLSRPALRHEASIPRKKGEFRDDDDACHDVGIFFSRCRYSCNDKYRTINNA